MKARMSKLAKKLLKNKSNATIIMKAIVNNKSHNHIIIKLPSSKIIKLKQIS